LREFHFRAEPDLGTGIADFMKAIGTKRKLAFYGELGAGKTTFIKYLCKQLKVLESVVSPTFSIVNEYSTQDNQLIYHIDLYRLETIEDALDIGIEEYLNANGYVFIEWPELIEPLLPADFLAIKIEVGDNEGRKIAIL